MKTEELIEVENPSAEALEEVETHSEAQYDELQAQTTC